VNNGLIVDYCGILKSLRQALATFAGSGGGDDEGEVDPVRPEEELLSELSESIAIIGEYLKSKGADLAVVIHSTGFDRIAAIDRTKEAVNENDETRKRFEIMARTVFTKFKACLTLKGVNQYRSEFGSINVIYKSLQEDRDAADISHIIQELHEVIEPAIAIRDAAPADGRTYDISKIDFDRLRREFEKRPTKRTDVQNLKDAIEKRLAMLMVENPLRTNFQQRYEEIVSAYNGEKDRVTIEATFEALIHFMGELDEESSRAIREGLTGESLALFDLLKKPNLEKKEIERIKKIAVGLLELLKTKKAEIDN
jgi:type I restriction enzyme, R subunit